MFHVLCAFNLKKKRHISQRSIFYTNTHWQTNLCWPGHWWLHILQILVTGQGLYHRKLLTQCRGVMLFLVIQTINNNIINYQIGSTWKCHILVWHRLIYISPLDNICPMALRSCPYRWTRGQAKLWISTAQAFLECSTGDGSFATCRAGKHLY